MKTYVDIDVDVDVDIDVDIDVDVDVAIDAYIDVDMDVDGDVDIDVDIVVDIDVDTDEWSLGGMWLVVDAPYHGSHGVLELRSILTSVLLLLLGGLEGPSLIAWPSAEVLRIGAFMHVY